MLPFLPLCAKATGCGSVPVAAHSDVPFALRLFLIGDDLAGMFLAFKQLLNDLLDSRFAVEAGLSWLLHGWCLSDDF